MPYKRGGIWYADVRVPGYGRVGPLSTRSRQKRIAKQMEAMLGELPVTQPALLEALEAGRFTLSELYSAKLNGGLEELAAQRKNPPLTKAIAEFLAERPDAPYRTAMNRLLKHAPDKARLSWVADADNLQAVVREYRVQGLKPATENREMIGVLLLIAKHYGKAKRAEIKEKLDLRKVRNNRTRWLDADEIGRVRKVAGDWWTIICAALSTGCRRGELFSLKVRDLDLEAGALFVQSGKTEAARRRLPLEGEALRLLRDWIASEELRPSDKVFGNVTCRKLEIAWNQIKQAAGIEDVVFHDLRHAYAVHCTQSGMPLVELKARMGHSSINQTTRYAIYQPAVTSTHYTVALDRMGMGQDVPTDIPTQKVA